MLVTATYGLDVSTPMCVQTVVKFTSVRRFEDTFGLRLKGRVVYEGFVHE